MQSGYYDMMCFNVEYKINTSTYQIPFNLITLYTYWFIYQTTLIILKNWIFLLILILLTIFEIMSVEW